MKVLLFSTIAAPERAARVHEESCALVAAARASRGKVKVISGDDVDDAIADLNDRGFPVRCCACVKLV